MERQAKKIRLTLSKQAERYARQDAPRDTRLMAAKGALPLPAIELATVLFALTHDPDAEVKATARDSLESLPATITNAVLSGPSHPALLSFLADCRTDESESTRNDRPQPATDDATIAKLAASPHKKVVEIISNNQERMLRAPEIVDALGTNPLTGRAVIERILNFLGAAAKLQRISTDTATNRRSPIKKPKPRCAQCSATRWAPSSNSSSRRRAGTSPRSRSNNFRKAIYPARPADVGLPEDPDRPNGKQRGARSPGAGPQQTRRDFRRNQPQDHRVRDHFDRAVAQRL